MATFTELFGKADGAGLGPDLTWSTTDPGSNWATSTQRGVITGITAAEPVARAEADTGSDDMYVELVLPDFGDASYGDVGLCVRVSADRTTRYSFKRITNSGGTSGQWELRKYVGGTLTTLTESPTDGAAVPFSFPERVRLEVEGSEIRAYIGGVLITSTTDTSITTGSFGGLDGFRNSTASTRRVIFDAFEAGQVQPAPVAAYSFDEGSGSTAADSSGNGHDLTLGAGTFVTGHTNTGLQSTASASNGASVAMSGPTTAVTLMAWVKPLSLTTGHTQPAVLLVNDVNSTIAGLFAQRGDFGTSNVLQANVRIGGTLRETSGAALTVDTWTHVAVTFDGLTIRLYTNGALTQTVAVAGTVSASTRLAVAGQSDYGNPANIVVDDVRVYDQALGGTAIAALMGEPVAGGGGGTALVVADAAHEHAADSVTLTQHHALTVADAAHVHAADAVTLVQHHVLTVAGAAHVHAAEAPALTQHHVLTVADAVHVHTVDNVTLGAGDDGSPDLDLMTATVLASPWRSEVTASPHAGDVRASLWNGEIE